MPEVWEMRGFQEKVEAIWRNVIKCKGRLIVYDMSCERVFKSTRISKKYVIKEFQNLYHDFLINKFLKHRNTYTEYHD